MHHTPKGVRYGGRKKGTPNKNPNELKALAQVYTSEAVETLAKHMRGEDPKASVAASKELLDRGFGKSVQFSEAKIEHRSVARIPVPAKDADEWAADHAPVH